MLPDFPTIKKKVQIDFENEIRKKIYGAPFLSQIRRKRVHEGDILASTSMDGYTDTRRYKLISSKFKVKDEKIIEEGVKAFSSLIDKISGEMIKKQSQIFFKKMDEVTKRTGNVVSAKGKPISPEIILESLEKVVIDFDEFGNPILPSFVVHPKQYEKIKGALSKGEADPELRKKYIELIEKKRVEWLDRENSRKLVD